VENPWPMSLRSPLTRRAGLGGLAVAGLVAGHCLAFRFFGDNGPHAHHHGGHSHAPYVFALIAGLLVAAIGSVIDHRIGARQASLGRTASLLASAQILGFLGLSTLDRVMGMPGTEIGSRAFWAGLSIQLLAAALGAVLLAVMRKAVEAIDELMHAELPRAVGDDADQTRPSLTEAIPSLAMAAGGPTFRGPPFDH